VPGTPYRYKSEGDAYADVVRHDWGPTSWNVIKRIVRQPAQPTHRLREKTPWQ
jgi:hypothetical protein